MPLFGEAGERIAYQVYPHPDDAPPILLIHGFTASSASFLSNIQDLRRNFTVVTVDLLGHGQSEAPAEVAPYQPEAAIARIVGLMDHLDYADAILCGHSLGGALALRVALDHPDRVAGLVVINSNSAAGTVDWRREVQPGLVSMARRVRTDGTGFLKETRLYPGRSSRLPERARARLAHDFDGLTAAGIAGTAEGLVARVNAFERLGELAVPILIVIGDRDAEFVHNAPQLIANLRHDLVSTVTLAGAGHAANLEQPEAFNDAVVDFARRIDFIGEEAPAGAGGRPRVLVLAGAALVTLGVGLLGASFMLGGGGDDPEPVSADEPGNHAAAVPSTATNTPAAASPSPAVTQAVAGVSVSATATTPAATPTEATPTPVPATSTPTPRPNTPTPVRATPTPTEEPTETPTPSPSPTASPTATPTPAGRGLSVSGPAELAVGETATYFANVRNPEGDLLTVRMSGGGNQVLNGAIAVSFSAPGCYTVSGTVYYPTGSISSSMTVAVGGATC
ncbi:MAG: alpha/beta fold hydrolase [Dehalococcoidia bacterium]|nr:alpha/beta fold hydrolase [Dehalococcoidia bacterium]